MTCRQLQLVFEQAKQNDNGQPKLIIARTEIGRGIPEVAGTAKAHGEGGAKFAEEARKGLGLPEETFYVSAEVSSYFAEHQASLRAYDRWQNVANWREAHPDLATELHRGRRATVRPTYSTHTHLRRRLR